MELGGLRSTSPLIAPSSRRMKRRDLKTSISSKKGGSVAVGAEVTVSDEEMIDREPRPYSPRLYSSKSLDPEYRRFRDTVEKHLAYTGHHNEGNRYEALVGLYSALDGKFHRPDLASLIQSAVVPGLLVLIEQPPPGIHGVLPSIDPARCHALALKTFGSCGDHAVLVGVPRLLELLRRVARSRRLPVALAGTWGFLRPEWVVNAIVRTGTNGVRALVESCLDGFDDCDIWALKSLAQHSTVQQRVIVPALIAELGVQNGRRRLAAVVALGAFQDRAEVALDSLQELLLTGATDQCAICDAIRATGEVGEQALCNIAQNSVRARERKVAAVALGKKPASFGQGSDLIYPLVEVRTGLEQEVIVKVTDNVGSNERFELLSIGVDSRGLLTQLKADCGVEQGLEFPVPPSSLNNPFLASPLKETSVHREGSSATIPFRLSIAVMETLSVLLDDKSNDVRAAAASSLVFSQIEWAIEMGVIQKLFCMLNDADGIVRGTVVRTLGGLGPRVLEMPLRRESTSNIGKSKRLKTPSKKLGASRREVSQSASAITLPNKSPWYKRSVAMDKQIDEGPTPVQSKLLQTMVRILLNDSLHKTRLAAAIALGKWGESSVHAIPAMTQTLAEGKVERGVVARAIGRTGEEGIRALTEIVEGVYLHRDTTYVYDIKLAERSRLKQRLQRGGVQVRVHAIHGLECANVSDEKFSLVIATLYRSLKYPMPAVRIAAVKVLGFFYGRSQSTMPYMLRLPDHLFGLLEDPHEAVRKQTAAVLASMNPKGEFFLVEATLNADQTTVRDAAAWGLRKVGARCIMSMIIALSDKSVRVQRTVGESICSLRFEDIVEHVQSSDPAIQDSFRMTVLEILEDDNKDSGVKNHLLKVMSAIAS